MSDTDVQIVFEQFVQPGLKDGQYTVTASVAMSDLAGAGAPTFAPAHKVLQVGSDATSLPAGSIVSVFPPDKDSGDYSGCLPHVLLNKPTIPWQKQVLSGADDKVPWVALLSLSDDELKSGGPSLVTATDGTMTLSMPLAFFRSIAPTIEELGYLSHVRRVETTQKVDSTETEIDYAVVVGNRLPKPQTLTYAYLVGLADQGDLLPGGAGTTDPVVLPVLTTWQFTAAAETTTFSDIIVATDRTPPTLGLPPTAAGAAGQLLSMGYVPMPHALRVGGDTVSLYRGPLVPYATTRTIANVPIQNADAVTLYDPSTGILDMSCAAAWTLGRLLALNAASYALALYNWKRAAQRATIDQLIYELDTGKAAPSTAMLGATRRLDAEHALAAFIPAALGKLSGTAGGSRSKAVEPTAAASPISSRAQRKAALRDAMTDPARIAQIHGLSPHLGAAPGDAPDSTDPNLSQVISWLGDLILLKPVPLFYLVPDERMLPIESIRFFQIDSSWMASLIDGALSLGRVTETDQSHDAAFRPMLQQEIGRAAASARARRRGALGATDPAPLPARPASGFLLRSTAVTKWPKLEVAASGPTGEATILRIEANGALLICLFDRPVDTVKLREPSEGVHFGFDDDGALSKTLRRLVDDSGGLAGSEIITIPPTPPLQPSYRGDSTLRVLDIKTLADTFNARLTPSQFTSAEFALEMVTGVEAVNFKLS
ncbi:hypothetical protein [Bradyrhizobium sp. S69]|uniref:hypothetical protein n=1 Tax=Bradyrhizobium sp. S69 TaxID=1641856 RepID=UPI00131E608B|nr:hypothetical protein [Bradyrhizobium sp. S69]